MAAIFIELDEAAKQLGVTAEQLNEMRLRGEIYGTRDGSTWKFKAEEVQRVAEELGISSVETGDDDVLGLATDSPTSSSDLHLEAEAEVSSDSPTAIGALEDLDDLGVTAGSDVNLGGEDDELRLRPEGSSDVALIPDSEGSGVNLVADEHDDILAGSDVGLDAAGTGDLDFEGSDLSIASDLTLDDAPKSAKRDAPNAEMTIGDDEELALSDDDELVLEGGSDVTGGSGGSGINLASPSDSGLNLEEEPLDLAGSSVSSLELPEDDDIIDLDELDALGEEGGKLKADEDFQLTASAMTGEEDEEDSGSQVIALEDSEAFGDAAGMLVEGEEAEPVLGQAEDELEGALDQYESSPMVQPAAQAGYAAPPEAPYSIWNIIALLSIFVVLGLTGMLMMDLVRNMWSWNEPFTASTPIMDMMIKLAGLNP
jgi:excisionase family DNA binding protein